MRSPDGVRAGSRQNASRVNRSKREPQLCARHVTPPDAGHWSAAGPQTLRLKSAHLRQSLSFYRVVCEFELSSDCKNGFSDRWARLFRRWWRWRQLTTVCGSGRRLLCSVCPSRVRRRSESPRRTAVTPILRRCRRVRRRPTQGWVRRRDAATRTGLPDRLRWRDPRGPTRTAMPGPQTRTVIRRSSPPPPHAPWLLRRSSPTVTQSLRRVIARFRPRCHPPRAPISGYRVRW